MSKKVKIDNVPAWLTEGEYVIKRKSAKKLGDKVLSYINKHGKLPKSDARKRRKKNAKG
tara:strand:- start:206 stop:382 length:177 start_codon:yes stop_codon:yes gene_type:complete